MPEGDTVFLAGRRLHEALAGQRLVRGELRHPRLATHDLAGCTVREVATAGKHLLTRFDNGRTLHSHLRMDGSWHLYRPGQPWRGGPLHTVRTVLQTADRVAVGYRLHDLELVPTEQEHRLVGHLGPDLLDPQWGPTLAATAATRLAAQPQRQLGLALMDQTVLAGIGNLYRAEICFLLGASPFAPVSAVDAEAAVQLAHTLLARNAWRPQQSTTGQLRPGAQHWVYGRTGRGCRRCGDVVRSDGQGEPGQPAQERTVYFCPSCQPMPPGLGRGRASLPAGAASEAVAPPASAGTDTATAPRAPATRRRPRING